MANTTSGVWKIECLVLRGITGLFLILSSLCHAHTSVEVNLMKRSGGCKESERMSLLAVKAGIYQPPGEKWLSTWRDGTDCCSWQGVGCDNVTGHVVELDLHYPYDLPSPFIIGDDNIRPGDPSKLNSSLLDLIHLKHLDLSMNNFSPNPIPEFLGSLIKLEYLNLSNAGFFGTIPPHLGNLSSLRSLDLHYNTYDNFPLSIGKDLHWLSTMTSLEYLDMSNVNFSKSGDYWIHDINMLPSLSVLLLSSVDLTNIPDALPLNNNLTSLATLDLSYNHFSSLIPGWLYNISSLRLLDLGYCSFKEVRILKVLSSFSKLEHLNLAGNYIIGRLPETLGNFTGLINLNLSGNEITGEIPKTIGKLYKLQSLDLSHNELGGEIPENMGSLCKLQRLRLASNNIAGEITSLVEELSRCSPGSDLHYLSLGDNNLNGTITAKLGQLSKLEELRLGKNSFVGKVTEAHFSNLINLKDLILSGNHLEMIFSQDWVPPFNASLIGMSFCHLGPHFPNWIRTQTLMEILYMSEAGISDNIPSWFWNYDIVRLDMSNNQIRGQLPPSLQRNQYEYLYLSSNYFDGHIPNLDPTHLLEIDLSNNAFCGPIPSSLAAAKGTIPPFNVYNLTSLHSLDLSNNNLTGTIPPFNSPQLGILSLSNNHLSGTIPPFNSPQLGILSLSNNHLTGTIPPFHVYNLTNLGVLDLSNNNLTGTIPPFNSPQLGFLSLSNNHLTGTIPTFNNLTSLQVLDLSKNNLGGRLPLFNSPRLVVLDLSSNNFSSHIPDSIGSLTYLQSLHLGNNSLTGRIPWSLHHCRQLVLLDLGENRLSGDIPAWIGEHLPLLRVLRLRSNFFRGDISFPICRLTKLQVLDLANNSLSGILSPSSLNFNAMLQTLNMDKPMFDKDYGYKENLMVTVKGMELEYTTVLSLVTSIDLSSNGLYGEIPKELAELHGLVSLNLSRNHFTGEIPENIGAMGQLESLDLSMNKLSGSIPPSMSNLDSLGHLNLSHNNLSGRIPSGNHLQTFFTDPSIYSGNLELCGWPLLECSSNEPSQAPSHEGGGTEEKKDETDVIWIYGIAAAGFIIGFWSVIGTLLIKVSWRITYFQLVDRFCDWVYVKLAISIARWKSIIQKD